MATIGHQKRMNTATALLYREQRAKKKATMKKLAQVRQKVTYQARKKSRQKLAHHRKTLNWNVDTIIQVIRDKILGRIRRAEERNVVAYKLLECPVQGINRAHLKDVLKRRFDLKLTTDEVNALFMRFDTDNSGLLDFNEFINGLLPPDYSAGGPPLTKNALSYVAKKTAFLPDQMCFPRHLDGEYRPKLKDIERQIREKIEARTKDPSSQYRLAFQMFGRTNRITRKRFSRRLQRWGIFLKPLELEALFQCYDDDNSGYIEFDELVNSVLKQDYPNKGPWFWERAKLYERKALAQKYGVPPNMLDAHLARKGLLTRQQEKKANLQRFKGAKQGDGRLRLNDDLALTGTQIQSPPRAIGTEEGEAGSTIDQITPESWGFLTEDEAPTIGMIEEGWGEKGWDDGDSAKPLVKTRKWVSSAAMNTRNLKTAPSRGTRKFLKSQHKRTNYTKEKDPFLWKYKEFVPEVRRSIMPGGNYSRWRQPPGRADQGLMVHGTRSGMIPVSPVKAQTPSHLRSRHSNARTDRHKGRRPKTTPHLNASRQSRKGSTGGSKQMNKSASFAKALNDALKIAATNDAERRQYSTMLASAGAANPQFARTNRFIAC